MPQEPWDIRTDDSRTEDTVATFIIFCEDENDEPYYFRSFSREHVLKVNAVSNQKQAKLNFLNAVTKCVEDGQMEYENGGYRIREGVSENIWSVYDRDTEHEDAAQIRARDNIDFTTAIDNAKATGIKVAWSNDAFELWILLHFEPVPTGAYLHRNYIYDRLTEVFKNLPQQSDPLKELTSRGNFGYKAHLKRRENFLVHVLPLLKDRQLTAIANAQALEREFPEAIPYHRQNPCTKVHHLVIEITKALTKAQ